MSGQMKRMGEGSTTWVWQDEEKAEPVECPSGTERPFPRNTDEINGFAYELIGKVLESKPEERLHPMMKMMKAQEPKHTIPPLDPESALAKCHALIQEQASELGEEMLARVEAEEKLECVSADLYSLNKTFKRVQGNADRYHENWQDAAAQLKTMAEDRDEYQAKYQTERSIVESWADENWRMESIYNALVLASVDEQMMVLTYARKLMGEGRTEHGALDLATDDRDLLGEGLDELDDVMSYLMMFKRRLELRRKADQCNAEGVHYCDGTNQCT